MKTKTHIKPLSLLWILAIWLPLQAGAQDAGPAHPITGEVYDARAYRKGRKVPVEGVVVDLWARGRLIKKKGQTDNEGRFFIYYDFMPGEDITLFLGKTPEYISKEYPCTYQERAGNLKVFLYKAPKIQTEWYFWSASALFAGSAAYFKIRSGELSGAYEKSGLFNSYSAGNEANLEADFAHNAFIGSAIGAGVSLGFGFLARYAFKDKNRAAGEPGIKYVNPRYFAGLRLEPRDAGIGLTYTFY